jgi:hypothetical protein
VPTGQDAMTPFFSHQVALAQLDALIVRPPRA